MQIIFAGQQIAADPPEGGFDAIDGFLPDGDFEVQIVKPMRATWATLFDRGNGVVTLTGRISPANPNTVNDAMKLRMLYLATLPRCGALIFATATTQVTFLDAVMKKPRYVEGIGISSVIELTFLATRPTATGANLQTGSGLNLETGSGQQIQI